MGHGDVNGRKWLSYILIWMEAYTESTMDNDDVDDDDEVGDNKGVDDNNGVDDSDIASVVSGR